MNRLLITVLLALAFAISLMGLAKGDNVSGQATMAQTTPSSQQAKTRKMHMTRARRVATGNQSTTGKVSPKKKILSQTDEKGSGNTTEKSTDSSTMKTVTADASKAPSPDASKDNDKGKETSMTMEDQKICNDQTCSKLTTTINGKTVTVTVKALQTKDHKYVTQTTQSDCDVCNEIAPLQLSVNNPSLAQIKQALDVAAAARVDMIKSKTDPQTAKKDDGKQLTEKQQEAMDHSKEVAEKSIKLCKATGMVLENNKYKLTGKLRGEKYIQCLMDHYEQFADSNDEDDSDLAPEILEALTNSYTQALKDQSMGKNRKALMAKFQDFIDNHSDANDNVGLRMQALGLAAAYQTGFGADMASVNNIRNLIAAGNLPAANEALQSLKLKTSYESSVPAYSQGALLARNNAAMALQKYTRTLGGTVPDQQVLQAMANLSGSAATSSPAGVSVQISQLQTQLDQKTKQMQMGQTGGVSDSAMAAASSAAAKSLVNSALESVPGALQFLSRGGAYPRDYSQYGDGAAAGIRSWRESAYHQNLGSPQGRLSPAALALGNGMINGTMSPARFLSSRSYGRGS